MLKSKLALVVPALLSLACESEVSDTERRVFDFECKTRPCTLTPREDSKGAPGLGDENEQKFVTQSDGRILAVCPAEQPGFDCRPLTCDSGMVCSQLGGSAFGCENGLCQAPQKDITYADRLALCLAETGPWTRSPAQIERLTLARACRAPCVLPAQCLEP